MSAPVARDRHTTLLARFDAPGSIQPDYERDGTGAAGRNYDVSVPGRFGGGIEIDIPGAQMNLRGHGNMRPDRGTVQFWVRSIPGQNIWRDGLRHCLFSAAAVHRDLELWKTSDNRLRLSWAGRHWKGDNEVVGSLDLPVSDLEAEGWHHLLFSWDDRKGRLWLALDGRLRSLSVGKPLEVNRFHILFLGASYYGGVGREGLDPRVVLQTAGARFDELKISDVTVREMLALRGRETHLPEKAAVRVTDAVCRHLDFISRLQVDGAWSAILYAWPHLLPGETSYRTYFHPGLDHFMELAHGRNGTPGAGRLFLYAYQVLGDQRYLEVARKAGEWLLSAQQPEGYWVNHYDRHTGGRPTPRREVLTSHRRTVHRDYPTFQDGRQSQAALFMARLYLVTLEERWLKGFRRSADFILKAQNPNGSWGYTYNLKEGRSENRNQDPHGAEFDNGNQRNQLRVMQLAHHLTGLDKYRGAIVRNGEWHLAAQLGPPTYGWALAYDGRNQPVWSRVYHPPGLSSGSSVSACENLFFLYDLTRDRKYLEPVARYLDWEKSALIEVNVDGERVPMRSQLVDHRTGRPIAVDLKNWTTYFLDTPQDRAAFLKTGSAVWANPDQISEEEFPWSVFMKRPDGPRLEPQLRKRRDGPRPVPVRMTRAQLAESVSQFAGEELGEILAQQNEKGVWPVLDTRPGAQGSYNIGAYFPLVESRAYQLLSLLERSKILSGEIEREIWSFPNLIGEREHGLRHRNWMAER